MNGGMRVVESFGNRSAPQEPEPPQVSDLPAGLPRITLVLVPSLDEDAYTAAIDRIRADVARAVRDGFHEGFAQALADVDEPDDVAEAAPDGEEPAGEPACQGAGLRRYDPNPTVNLADPYAYAKYAEKLDREVPGWFRDDTDGLAPELAEQARLRFERERRTAVPVGR